MTKRMEDWRSVKNMDCNEVRAELVELRKETARLLTLLKENGIDT